MRLIDADKFKQEIAAITVKNNLVISKCNAMWELIDNQPTAYDPARLREKINLIGKSYCNSVKCDKNCVDCEHGCLMRAIEKEIVKGDGINV